MNQAETIYALASGIGVSGLQVFRVSGPQSGDVLKALTAHPLPSPRVAPYTKFVPPNTGADLDQGLILWFPPPASNTVEVVAEIPAHGGRAVRAAFLGALSGVSGLRQSDPGEYTLAPLHNSHLF